MELLKCPECGNEITASLKSCPNCGCPVSMMSSITNDNHSKWQKRMVSLAMPIGIMAILMVLDTVFGSLRSLMNIDMSNSQSAFIGIMRDLLAIITYTFLFVWFLSLHKGSVTKSKMKNISLIALIGIGLYLLLGFFFLWIDLTLYINEKDSIYIFYGWNLVVYLNAMLKFILLGCAFCALNSFFNGKIKIYVLFTGVLFLLRGLLYGLVIGQLLGVSQMIFNILELLSYILMAKFFMKFNKTYKLQYNGRQ